MPPSPESSRPQKESAGAIIGIIIILALMIVGAVYFWFARQSAHTESVPYITGGTSTTSAS